MSTREQIAKHLRTARDTLGMTQAVVADALGLHRPAIAEIEAGRRAVTSEELYRLAALYGRSVSDLLEGSPLEEVEAVLFRGKEFESPEARVAVRRFVERCRTAKALEELLGIDRPANSPRTPYARREPTSIADAFREGERVAERERLRLGLGTEPVRDPVAVLESQGLRVGPLDPDSPLDGVYFNTTRLGACVGINEARDRWTGFRTSFTVVHEYGHWLLDDVRAEAGIGSEERFTTDLCEHRANAFAAAFLMPRTAVHRYFAVAGLLDSTGRVQTLNPAVIVRAMQHFGVSRQALLLRLKRLELISHATCDDAWKREFPLRPVAEALGISLRTEHPIAGRFADLVARAWAEGHITTGRAAGLLDLDIEDFRERMETLGVTLAVPPDALLLGGGAEAAIR